jgi:purine nucleosidase
MSKTAKCLSLILAAVMLALLSPFGAEARAEGTADGTAVPVRKMIIDTDTGADDAAAMILAAGCPEVEILGVTVLAGNVDLEQAARNALAALEIAGCDAPVFKGATKHYSGDEINIFSVYGKDGMGDQDLVHPHGTAREEYAVDFILETVRENPGEIEIVLLGPATNIASAIIREPETMKQVKRFWSMGTAGLGTGNASPVAEFNVYKDAPAYSIMLELGVPVTVVGLDMCRGDAMWTDEQFDRLYAANEIGCFVTKSFSALREFYRSNGSPNATMNCDAGAMMCVVYPEYLQSVIPCHGSCVTYPCAAYGQVVFFQEGFNYDVLSEEKLNYNVQLANKVDGARFFDLYLERVN